MAMRFPIRFPHRMLCAAVVGAGLVGSSLTQSTAAAAATRHPDFITLLAGSPQFVVYELTRDPNSGTTPPTGSPYRLVARRADGKQQTFQLGKTQTNRQRWSLAGSMLTAVDLNTSTAPPDIYW